MGANAIFTLGSVPLALSYLPKAEFGLWALTMQVAGYIALIDLGMSGAVFRILIEYKDKPESAEYASLISTGVAVNMAQALAVLAGGVGVAWVLAPLLAVPVDLELQFRWLMIWQSIGLAMTFAGRIVTNVLAAHQRQDVSNYAQLFSLIISFAVLWICFGRGLGLFSMIWAQLAGQTVAVLIVVAVSLHLKMFPRLKAWGRPSWARFRELFAYSCDMFLYSVGSQLVNASQTILITRMLGLEMGAIWAICTRTFSLISQIVYRIFDYSCPALAEMMVRGEIDRLRARFRTLVVSSSSLTVAAGVMLFVCNQSFVVLWTGGKITWPSVNDLLLGCWLVITVLVRSHTGLIGLTRDFRFLRYIYFLEGLFFVVTALVALRLGGITAMIAASIIASLLFSSWYSIRRNAHYFDVPIREIVVDWMWPSIRLCILLVPAAAAVWFLTSPLADVWRFSINAAVVGAVAAMLLWRFGLETPVRAELQNRLLSRFSRLAPSKP